MAHFSIRPVLLGLYRMGVLVAVFCSARAHWQREQERSRRDVRLSDVREFLPEASALLADREGDDRFVLEDRNGNPLGWALSTSPIGDEVIGYAGPTQSLLVFGPDDRLLGIRILHSLDTVNHVEDVRENDHFLKQWDGLTPEALAKAHAEGRTFDGVSGATRTSTAIGQAITLRAATWTGQPTDAPAWTWRRSDSINLFALFGGLVFSFLHFKGKKVLRRIFQVSVLLGVGIFYGDLLALSLFEGWSKAGIPWRATPGLLLLAAGALIIPWTTRKPLYCGHVCPFGILQEWMGRLIPAKWKWHVPGPWQNSLRQLPLALLSTALVSILLGLPLNLAGLEPFDAFSLQSLVAVSTWIALGGLLLSGFVPMAYCRFGCPTGELLRYVRVHGKTDTFRRSDLGAGLLVLLAWGLVGWGDAIRHALLEAL